MKPSYLAGVLASSTLVSALPSWLLGSDSVETRSDNSHVNNLDPVGREYIQDDIYLDDSDHPGVTLVRAAYPTHRHGHGRGHGRGRNRNRKGDCDKTTVTEAPILTTPPPYPTSYPLIGNGTFPANCTFGNGTGLWNSTSLWNNTGLWNCTALPTTTLTTTLTSTITLSATDAVVTDNNLIKGIEVRALEILDAVLGY